MKTKYTVALSMLAGVAIGAVAVQGLQAQGKPKAYTVSELESLERASRLHSTRSGCHEGRRWSHAQHWWGKGCWD